MSFVAESRFLRVVRPEPWQHLRIDDPASAPRAEEISEGVNEHSWPVTGTLRSDDDES